MNSKIKTDREDTLFNKKIDPTYLASFFGYLKKYIGIEFLYYFFLENLKYGLHLIFPFILYWFFSALDSFDSENIIYYGFITIIYSIFLICFDFFLSWKRRIFSFKIKSFSDQVFFSKLMEKTPEYLRSKKIVPIQYFESYSSQFTNICYLPDFLAGILAILVASVLFAKYLGETATITIFLTSFLYILFSVFLVKKIGSIYYSLVKSDKERIGVIQSILENFKSFKIGKYQIKCQKLIDKIRNSQIVLLKKRASYQVLNNTISRLISTVLITVLVLLIEQDKDAFIVKNIFIVLIAINVLLGFMEESLSSYRVLYNTYIVHKRVKLLFDFEKNNDEKSKSSSIKKTNNKSNFDLIESGSKINIKSNDLKQISEVIDKLIYKKQFIDSCISINIPERIGYLGKDPFINNDSIRNNIILDKPFDNEKYLKILDSLDLLEDIKRFENSDLKPTGEYGHNLSGGQKIRIALARTAYQEYDVYVFRDIFVNLNREVATKICQKFLHGVLKNNIVFSSTTNEQYGQYFSYNYHAESSILVENAEFSNSAYDLRSQDSQAIILPKEVKTNPNESEKKTLVENISILRILNQTVEFFSSKIVAAIAIFSGVEIYLGYRLNITINSWKNNLENDFQYSQVYSICFCLIVLTISKFYVIFYSGLNKTIGLHKSGFSSLVYSQYMKFKESKTGHFLNTLGKDFNQVEMQAPASFSVFVFAVLSVVSGNIFLAFINPIMAIFLLPILVMSYVIYRKQSDHLVHLSRKMYASRQYASSFISECNQSFYDFKVLDIKKWAQNTFKKTLILRESSSLQYSLSVVYTNFLTDFILNLIFIFGIISACLCVRFNLFNDYSSYLTLSIFFIFTFKSEFRSLLGKVRGVENSIIALERYKDLLQPTISRQADRLDRIQLRRRNSKIIFDQVEFSFKGNQVFQSVNLTLVSGDHVILSGRTGSGKSTLLDLISGIYQPDKGKILYLSSEYETRKLPFYYVPQNLWSIDMKISDFLESKDINDTGYEGILIKYKAVIDLSPDRKITELDQNERQILEILRMSSFNPSIILMDETLASCCETLAYEILQKLIFKNSNTIILYASHRLYKNPINKLFNKNIKIDNYNTIVSNNSVPIKKI